MKNYIESIEFLIKQQKRKDIHNNLENIFNLFKLDDDLLEELKVIAEGRNLNDFDFSILLSMQKKENPKLNEEPPDLISFSDDE